MPNQLQISQLLEDLPDFRPDVLVLRVTLLELSVEGIDVASPEAAGRQPVENDSLPAKEVGY